MDISWIMLVYLIVYAWHIKCIVPTILMTSFLLLYFSRNMVLFILLLEILAKQKENPFQQKYRKVHKQEKSENFWKKKKCF